MYLFVIICMLPCHDGEIKLCVFAENYAPRQKNTESYKNCGSLWDTAEIANLRQNVKIVGKNCGPQHRDFLQGLLY